MAHNSPAKSRDDAGRFRRGQSGNPRGKKPGTKNRSTREIRRFCRDLFERPKFQKTLKAKWDDFTLDPQFRQLLTHYAWGRPVSSVQVGASGDLARLLAGDDEDGE